MASHSIPWHPMASHSISYPGWIATNCHVSLCVRSIDLVNLLPLVSLTRSYRSYKHLHDFGWLSRRRVSFCLQSISSWVIWAFHWSISLASVEQTVCSTVCVANLGLQAPCMRKCSDPGCPRPCESPWIPTVHWEWILVRWTTDVNIMS